MTDAPWTYPPELLDALGGLGLRPTPATPPAAVREALNDLYRYELRGVRDRHKAGEVSKAAFVAQVIGLRKKCWPRSLLVAAWETIWGGAGR
jgi:hypothetical protein